MYNFKLALQLYSLRGDMEADFRGTLEKVKEMGYDGVEFAGLFGHSAEEVNAMCKEIGLTPISAHVSYDEQLKGEKTFETFEKIGCKFIVIPWIEADRFRDPAQFAEFVENVKKLGELANKHGMKLCYHNHDFEFEKVDGEYMLDRLYSAVPAELLSTQLDTCWVNVGGENPTDYINKYADRLDIVHLKDFAGCKSENMYGLIGVAEDKKEAADGSFELRPVGYGIQNVTSILDAAENAHAQWVVIEQDDPSMGKTPLECVKLSIDYVKSVS